MHSREWGKRLVRSWPEGGAGRSRGSAAGRGTPDTRCGGAGCPGMSGLPGGTLEERQRDFGDSRGRERIAIDPWSRVSPAELESLVQADADLFFLPLLLLEPSLGKKRHFVRVLRGLRVWVVGPHMMFSCCAWLERELNRTIGSSSRRLNRHNRDLSTTAMKGDCVQPKRVLPWNKSSAYTPQLAYQKFKPLREQPLTNAALLTQFRNRKRGQTPWIFALPFTPNGCREPRMSIYRRAVHWPGAKSSPLPPLSWCTTTSPSCARPWRRWRWWSSAL